MELRPRVRQRVRVTGVVRPRMIKHRVSPEIQSPDKHEKSQTDDENGENDDAPPLKHGTINALFLPPGKSISLCEDRLFEAKSLLQGSAFAEQFHHGNHHVEH